MTASQHGYSGRSMGSDVRGVLPWLDVMQKLGCIVSAWNWHTRAGALLPVCAKQRLQLIWNTRWDITSSTMQQMRSTNIPLLGFYCRQEVSQWEYGSQVRVAEVGLGRKLRISVLCRVRWRGSTWTGGQRHTAQSRIRYVSPGAPGQMGPCHWATIPCPSPVRMWGAFLLPYSSSLEACCMAAGKCQIFVENVIN